MSWPARPPGRAGSTRAEQIRGGWPGLASRRVSEDGDAEQAILVFSFSAAACQALHLPPLRVVPCVYFFFLECQPKLLDLLPTTYYAMRQKFAFSAFIMQHKYFHSRRKGSSSRSAPSASCVDQDARDKEE